MSGFPAELLCFGFIGRIGFTIACKLLRNFPSEAVPTYGHWNLVPVTANTLELHSHLGNKIHIQGFNLNKSQGFGQLNPLVFNPMFPSHQLFL